MRSKEERAISERKKALKKAAEIFEERIIPAFDNYDKALDIGTGNGYTTFTLAKYFRNVVSIDVDLNCLEAAKIEAAEKKLSNIQFSQIDAHEINFPDKSFDVVTCRASIHHLDNPHKVLSEVYRVLKGKGFFVLMDFCFSEVTKNALFPLSRIREDDFRGYYTFHEYCSLLENNGFSIEVIYTYTLPRSIQEWAAVAPENIQERIVRAFLGLNDEVHKELRLHKEGDQFVIMYRIVEIISKKGVKNG